jgi:uncharacterized protein YraI
MPVPSLLRTAPRSRRFASAPPLNLLAVIVLMLSSLGIGFGMPRQTDAVALGTGEYSLAAMVFGTDRDQRVGNWTSSGYRLRSFDRVAALPGCTESSCPWLPVDAPKDDSRGAQTLCAERDGLCWVEVISEATGICAVAPVRDLGPLFTRDNWWELRKNRTYYFKRGLPAAEAAADGADLGYGPGISDAGLNVAEDYAQGAGIALGAGTWLDLGLDPEHDVTSVQVKLLWQTGISHDDACGGTYGNAETIDSVNLRATPSTATEIQAVIPPGRRLAIVGPMEAGFYQVDIDGLRGWIQKEFVQPDDNRIGGRVGFLTGAANFRADPSSGGEIFRNLPRGAIVVITGKKTDDFFPILSDGREGWVESASLDIGTTRPVIRDLAIPADDLNFRTGPGLKYAVIAVAPAGTTVILRGDHRNGFRAVLYAGEVGWMAEKYLQIENVAPTMSVIENLNLRTGPSTADGVILVIPAGGVVTVTGDAQNGFLAVTYQGQSGWAFAQYLDG